MVVILRERFSDGAKARMWVQMPPRRSLDRSPFPALPPYRECLRGVPDCHASGPSPRSDLTLRCQERFSRLSMSLDVTQTPIRAVTQELPVTHKGGILRDRVAEFDCPMQAAPLSS